MVGNLIAWDTGTIPLLVYVAEQQEEMNSGDDLTCIPLMVAGSPGKVDREAAKEVEEGPGQNNDVVDVEEDDDHLRGIADAWMGRGAELG